MRYTSGNHSPVERGWTYEALVVGLEYTVKLLATGMKSQHYLDELKHRIEACYFGYAGLYAGVNGVSYDQIDLWSEKAIAAYSEDKSNVRHFIKEHGTPRAAFAQMILDIYRKGQLTKEEMNRYFDTYYKLAVITKDEDRQLNRIMARSKMYDTPEKRWAAAGIKIVSCARQKLNLHRTASGSSLTLGARV